jgi:hypothetical protein
MKERMLYQLEITDAKNCNPDNFQNRHLKECAGTKTHTTKISLPYYYIAIELKSSSFSDIFTIFLCLTFIPHWTIWVQFKCFAAVSQYILVEGEVFALISIPFDFRRVLF